MKTLRGSISKLRRPKLPLRHPLLGHAEGCFAVRKARHRAKRLVVFCRLTLRVQAQSPWSGSMQESLPA